MKTAFPRNNARTVLTRFGSLVRYTATSMAALLLSLTMGMAFAQGYPAKPVRLVVGYPPGGTADNVSRALAERLGSSLGQSVVVENRPGALAFIAAMAVAKADPDGYTLLLMPATQVLGHKLVKSLSFDPVADFTPISTVAFVPTVILAGKDQPFNTMQEMLQYASKNEGKVVVGVSDVSGLLTVVAINQSRNYALVTANYKGGAPIGKDILGGHLPAGILGVASMPASPKEGRLKALAVTSPKRLAIMPDVPTIAETLGIENLDLQTWFGLVGPKGMPQPVIERLQAAISRALADPAIRDRMAGFGVVPAEDTTPAGLVELIKRYVQTNSRLIDAAGLQPE